MSDKPNDKSFWTTANGIITSLAALITAVGGIVSIIYTVGPFSSKSTTIAEVATLPANSPTPVAISSPTLPPSPASPTLMPPTVTPTVIPSTVTPTPTIVLPSLTPTRTLTPTATATIPPPTIAIKPGVYGLTITTPNALQRGLVVPFTVTFLNTTAGSVNYNWFVKIYRPENMRNSFSETPKQQNSIPVGKTSLRIDWQGLRGPGGCETFVARAILSDANNQLFEFRNLDESITQSEPFNICP